MLIEEARWFSRRVLEMDPARVFPMLDAGSSSERFRKRVQPWIDAHLFRPMRERGLRVTHADATDAPGVDLVGDFRDGGFVERLVRMRFQSVMCCNLLELVPNREEIARALSAVVPRGGYLFASANFSYPYHPEPVDTMFRPGVEELAGLFPSTVLETGEILRCGTYLSYVARGAYIPFLNPRSRRATLLHLPWLFRPFQVTCLVLRKDGQGPAGAS